jgi:hypothetical protein
VHNKPMDLKKAIRFVSDHGDAMQEARLKCVLGESLTPWDLIGPFLDLQNADGGYPVGLQQGNLSTVEDTLDALWWMEELLLLKSVVGQSACEYLTKKQQHNGCWDADPGLATSHPQWIIPGNLGTQMYLTSYAAYWLFLTGDKNSPAVDLACKFLMENQTDTGRFTGPLHATWLSASDLYMRGYSYHGYADKAVFHLASLPLSQWEDSQLAWAINSLGNAGVSSDMPFIANGLKELQLRQDKDGSWCSEDGPAYAVEATIEVIKTLRFHKAF